MENGRNAVGLVGLSLLGARWLGERGAVLLPISYLFGAFLLGRTGGSPVPSWWAWVLFDGGSSVALGCAAILGLLGLSALPRLGVGNLRQGPG